MFGSYLGDAILDSQLQGAGAKLFYSVTKDTAKKRTYLKVVNAESLPQNVDIRFDGGNVAQNGKLVMLKALSTEATNTINQPENIVPVESNLRVGSELRYNAPAYSIQVIQVDER